MQRTRPGLYFPSRMNRSALWSVAILAGAAVLAAGGDAPALMPPPGPQHQQRHLDTASALARDLAEIVAFLEQGQSYFKAYKKGTHSAGENAALLRFLEAYERERAIAQREADLLLQWVKQRSDLEPADEKATQKPRP